MDARSVIPGFTSNTFFCSSLYILTYLGTSGLGPTRLICPLKTFINCGSSSSLYFLKNAPILVILLSFPTVICLPNFSASTTIVLNLKISNSLFFSPTLICLKNTGPSDPIFILIAIAIKIGLKTISPKVEHIKSNILLTTLLNLFMYLLPLKLFQYTYPIYCLFYIFSMHLAHIYLFLHKFLVIFKNN